MTDHPYPKRSGAQATGEVGITLVTEVVQRVLGWEFRRTPQESDFGIDGYIDIVTEQGYVTGKSLAVQIKTGASYLVPSGSDAWVYRGELKHVNYYLNSPVPVLLLLVEPIAREIWWVMFAAYETDRTPSGWSTTVPRANKLASSKRALAALAGASTDYLPHLEDHWLLGERVKDHALVLIQVNRSEIESCLVRPLERLLERLSSSREVAAHARNKVDFLVDGYNDDPRELFEVPEVRRWVAALIGIDQPLAYFLHMGPMAQALPLIVRCRCTTQRVDDSHVMMSEFPVLLPFMDDQFAKLNAFTTRHDLEEVNRLVSKTFTERLMAMTRGGA